MSDLTAMKLEKRNSTLSVMRSSENTAYRSRMKKVAPPPPPPLPPPPLTNGGSMVRRTSAAADYRRTSLSTPGEDCAIDERLEGRVDVDLVLPDCRVVRMNLDRKTPMMDLLVQATTSNRISPSGHVLTVVSKDDCSVPYQPSTPLGSLDPQTLYLVPKSSLEQPVKRMPKLANQPFEQQTFRLQVNLPRQQRMVLRVSPRDSLDILHEQICTERELDPASHHLVHPTRPDTVLDRSATLDLYGCAEITLMSTADLQDSIQQSSFNNLCTYQKPRNRILRLFSRRRKDSPAEATNGSLPTSRSDNSLNRHSYQPKASLKRKPAPAPPSHRISSPPLITQSCNSLNSRPESEISLKTADEAESSVSHSRHSSDSSGYHEPSVFSDCSENKSPESSILHSDGDAIRQGSPLHKDYPDTTVFMKRTSMTTKETNLRNVPSCSNVSISSASRKRRAPQPPATNLPAIESPASPNALPLEISEGVQTDPSPQTEEDTQSQHSSIDGSSTEIPSNADNEARVQQESEAIQYLEYVLQESENNVKSYSHMVMDDSDTDSLKDEGEVISVCQAEVHADANDHDSSDSVVEPDTVVTPEPLLPNTQLVPTPSTQTNDTEAIDTSADDSGISQSLNSDADSSLPSLNSELKALSDPGCPEELYCNVLSGTSDSKTVPSEIEIPHADILYSNIQESENLRGTDTNAKNQISSVLTDDIVQADENLVKPNDPIKESLLTKSDVDTFIQPKSYSDIDSKSVITQSESDCGTISREKNSVASSISGDSVQSSATHTPQVQRKLNNFALGCYKSDDIDIYSEPSKNTRILLEKKAEVKVPAHKSQTEVGVNFESPKHNNAVVPVDAPIGDARESSSMNTTKKLARTARSASLYNLVPQPYQRVIIDKEVEDETESVVKKTHSQQDIEGDKDTIELKEAFRYEQKRLQEEYKRLQEQFISWQKQLMYNQSLLQSEKIIPEMLPFPSVESLGNLEMGSKDDQAATDTIENSKLMEIRTKSLPRPKKNSLSFKESDSELSTPLTLSPVSPTVVDIGIDHQPVHRPTSLSTIESEDASFTQDDKTVQVPSPQDKNTQVPSPQEKVTSGTQAPSPETVLNKDAPAQTGDSLKASPETSSVKSLSSPESEDSKCQTLPRPKPKPISALPSTQTMTLNRGSRPKSQVVAVTIGSWHQRQTGISDIEPLNVASSRSKFMSLENIPQSSSKPVPATMERRKLPPVPSETDHRNTVVKVVQSKPDNTITKTEYMNKSSEIVSETDKLKTRRSSSSDNRVSKTFSRQTDEAPPKPKVDIKIASKEPPTTFKLAKPFVKLTSMKDEPHSPSIIGLRKWPLSDMNETHSGRHTIVEDLKAGSKKPGAYVQEKIRRAEVDLRKPKSTKNEERKQKTEVEESSKMHITKISLNNSQPNNETVPKRTQWNSNTLPKSQSLNTELMSVFSKKAAAKKEDGKSKDTTSVKVQHGTQTVTINGSVQSSPPPPPPPPPQPSHSGMPAIPPAEQIPVSSQLLMAGNISRSQTTTRKLFKKSHVKPTNTADPREELMLEIRGFGGKQALRKAPSSKAGWNLKVYGTSSAVNT